MTKYFAMRKVNLCAKNALAKLVFNSKILGAKTFNRLLLVLYIFNLLQ